MIYFPSLGNQCESLRNSARQTLDARSFPTQSFIRLPSCAICRSKSPFCLREDTRQYMYAVLLGSSLHGRLEELVCTAWRRWVRCLHFERGCQCHRAWCSLESLCNVTKPFFSQERRVETDMPNCFEALWADTSIRGIRGLMVFYVYSVILLYSGVPVAAMVWRRTGKIEEGAMSIKSPVVHFSRTNFMSYFDSGMTSATRLMRC